MEGLVQYDVSPIKGPLVNAFILLINSLFLNIRLIGDDDVYPKDRSSDLLKEKDMVFDFIIVGGGTAGCMLANRISQYEQFSVLLLEAGDYPSASTEVPGLHLALIGLDEDWSFAMEKEPKACQAFHSGMCTIHTKGKVLGGSSTINDMIYSWDGEYDLYSGLNEDKWSQSIAEMILEMIEGFEYQNGTCFDMNETCAHPDVFRLTYLNRSTPIKSAILSGYRSTGSNRMPRRQFIGYTERPSMLSTGTRWNSAKAFLSSVKERSNLILGLKAEVKKVNITGSGSDRRANGVEVVIEGRRMFLRANKEVILTAGAINNPKLLLNSGVGPAAYLNSKKIPPIANLPGVGKNLLMRTTLPVFVSFSPVTGPGPSGDRYQGSDLIEATFRYVTFRDGELSGTGIRDLVNYIRRNMGGSKPDLMIEHDVYKIEDRNLLGWLDSVGYNTRTINKILGYNSENVIVVFMVTILNPRSSGEVLLNETHFESNPSIRGNLLMHDEDLLDLIHGINYVFNVTTNITKARHYAATFLDVDVPNCRNLKFCTWKYLQCYATNMAYPNGDVTGTMKIGQRCQEKAVVDEDLEVMKVRCLRVGDSSVLSSFGMGHTTAEDALIGFKLGEVLKEKWLKDYTSPFKISQKQIDYNMTQFE